MNKKLCDNAVMSHNNYIGIPKCYNSPQQYEVIIKYANCIGDEYEQEVLYLCEECLKER